jgi:chemotaxis protein methyltransferase CheR
MGLYFPRERWDDFERHIKLAASESGFSDTDAFLQWLLSSPLTQGQIEILASYLTISETYFWREPQVFGALREQILPDLIRKREAGERRLRIWSAGCATGEEAYSIAILLRELIPDLKNWNITLLATDINPNILRRAAAGVYGEWSFRNTPPELKQRYFCQIEAGKFEIIPEVRKLVTFSYLNLAEDEFPSPINNTNAMDLIFCRNVLMYFTKERTQQVGQRLYHSLLNGGWLIVAASELSQKIFPQFSSICFPGAIVYRREGENSKPPVLPIAQSMVSKKPDQPSMEAVGVGGRAAQPSRKEKLLSTEGVEKATEAALSPDVAFLVRTLANQGKLDEAWMACEQALISDKLNLGLYFLGAVILQEQNREAEARAALNRALYLDPNFVLGHYSLGNLARRQGNEAEASKHFKNTLALLGTHNPEELLPEAEGLTAGWLREIILATRR